MPRWVTGAGLVVLAWALSFGLVAVHAAWLLVPVVWLGTAALLRAGETLLDRLVLSGLLIAASLMIIGVPLSEWPWGLAPAPIAGLLLTAIVLVWTVSRRRLVLPRPAWSDAIPVGAAAVVTFLAAVPYLRATDFAGRLGALMSGEDSTRHASLVDQIRDAGAYTFLHPRRTSDILNPGMADYPQGWHMLVGMFENFLTSSTRLGSDEGAMTMLMVMLLATFFALILVVTWGAGRVAGLRARLGAYVLVVGGAGWLAASSELVRGIVYTYAAEMISLAFFAGLIVVAVRPAAKIRDQIALLSILTVGVGFTYYLFLPVALVIALGAVIADRRRMKKVPFSVAVGVLICGLSPMQAVAGLMLGKRDEQITLGKLGSIRLVELVVFVLVVAVGVVIGRRQASWRRYGFALATTLAAAAALNLYLRYAGSDPGYYFGKMLHIGVVVLILGTGAIGLAAGPLTRRLAERAGTRAVAGAVVAILVLCAAGQVAFGRPSLTDFPWMVKQVTGAMGHPDRAERVVAIAAACPAEPDVPTVVFFGSEEKNFGYNESIFLTVLQRQAGEGYMEAYGLPRSPDKRAEVLVRRAGPKVRVVIGDETARAALAAALRADPARADRIVPIDLADLLRTGECKTVVP